MNHIQHTAFLLFILAAFCLVGCNLTAKPTVEQAVEATTAQPAIDSNEYLLQVCDANANCGYANQKGDTVIALGKYEHSFTDTFRTYAVVVVKGKAGFMAIDRKGNVLYQVFAYDNGPDYPAEGLFRIQVGNKIGYADETTGKIVIQPLFDCAYPFENGAAQVSTNCKTEHQKEHSSWLSDHWFYIDATGKKVNKPE